MSFDNQLLEKYNVKLISSEYTTYDIVNDFLMNNQSEQPFYIIDLGEIMKVIRSWQEIFILNNSIPSLF